MTLLSFLRYSQTFVRPAWTRGQIRTDIFFSLSFYNITCGRVRTLFQVHAQSDWADWLAGWLTFVHAFYLCTTRSHYSRAWPVRASEYLQAPPKQRNTTITKHHTAPQSPTLPLPPSPTPQPQPIVLTRQVLHAPQQPHERTASLAIPAKLREYNLCVYICTECMQCVWQFLFASNAHRTRSPTQYIHTYNMSLARLCKAYPQAYRCRCVGFAFTRFVNDIYERCTRVRSRKHSANVWWQWGVFFYDYYKYAHVAHGNPLPASRCRCLVLSGSYFISSKKAEN